MLLLPAAAGTDEQRATADRGKAETLGGKTPPCECSTESNYCDTITNPTPNCRLGNCMPYEGCGTLWLYTCNGMCAQGAPIP